MNEFELIAKYFQPIANPRDDVVLGIGDDAAIVCVPAGYELAVAMDVLVAGVHFDETWSAEQIAYRALAVNLSDMAAMGAQPTWVTLGLTVPEANENWLQSFSNGFLQLAAQHQVQLIGGDMTCGPLTVAVQINGLIPSGQALRRDGAAATHDIYVTGSLGGASFALQNLATIKSSLTKHEYDELEQSLYYPAIPVKFATELRGLASAAIDISDGLAADLGHILEQSHMGAVLSWQAIPKATALAKHTADQQQQPHVLYGGDDYQLCFTAPACHRDAIMALATKYQIACTQIGYIQSEESLQLSFPNGHIEEIMHRGYQHFG